MKENSPFQFTTICFCVIAHADDWQLFMSGEIFKNLLTQDCKVVFIITTAGDAGMNEMFWLAREEGLKSSIRFCLAPFSLLLESSGTATHNGQAIQNCKVNNTCSYFLRLPDGNLDGNGFAVNNFASLAKFRKQEISPLNSVDNNAVYNTWSALVNTVEAIIHFESQGIETGSIYYLNPSSLANPNDHPDHTATGQILQDMPGIKTLQQLLFKGYSTRNSAEELPAADAFWKAGMMAAYDKAVYDACGYSTLKEDPDLYAKWCCSQSQFIIFEP